MILFYNEMTVLPFDEVCVIKFKYLKSLRLKHIGTNDLKIAAVTLCAQAVVLTANRRHFDLVEGLTSEDWIHDGADPDPASEAGL